VFVCVGERERFVCVICVCVICVCGIWVFTVCFCMSECLSTIHVCLWDFFVVNCHCSVLILLRCRQGS